MPVAKRRHESKRPVVTFIQSEVYMEPDEATILRFLIPLPRQGGRIVDTDFVILAAIGVITALVAVLSLVSF